MCEDWANCRKKSFVKILISSYIICSDISIRSQRENAGHMEEVRRQAM